MTETAVGSATAPPRVRKTRERCGALGNVIKFNCSRFSALSLVVICVVVQISVVQCFVVSGEEGGQEKKVEKAEVSVLPGNLTGVDGLSSELNEVTKDISKDEERKSNSSSVSLLEGGISLPHANNSNHDTNHHHHQWGKRNQTGHHNHTFCNQTGHGHDHDGDHHSDDKIEQILWDIFVEEDEAQNDEVDVTDDESPNASSDATNTPGASPEKYREDHEDEEPNDSDSTFEEILSDSIAAHNEDDQESDNPNDHMISKRSVPDDPSVAFRSGHRHPRPHSSNRHHSPSHGKKFKPAPKKQHRVTSRRHTRPRSKTKKSSNVSKYNEYMDVVLKRMNSMIKTKQMDPLMVNLFSGGNGNQQQQQKKPVKKPDAGKKKNKKAYTGRKKRKGAKNRGRMEEIEDEVEGRSVSSDSGDSSGTVEVDERENGIRGVGGVLIRRVGVREDEDDEDGASSDDEEEDEENDGGEEQDNERRFREIRALIVNGSMKRSTADSASTNETDSPKPIPAPSTVSQQNATKSSSEESSPQETRGFGTSPSSSSTTSSSEESPRKKQSTSKNKNKKKTENSNKKNNKPNKKNKQSGAAKKKTKPTRGVLKGLSSLKRAGNVDVVRQSDNVRIVRGTFTLGPVTLEIVPRGGKKQVAKGDGEAEEEEEERSSGKKGKHGKGKSKKEDTESEPAQSPKVTAVARELKGVIEIRIKKHSPTTIKKLRVFPPSSVKIKSNSKTSPTKSPGSSSVPRYSRVTPVATHRLRQIASAVVRQADVKRKSSSLEASAAATAGAGKKSAVGGAGRKP